MNRRWIGIMLASVSAIAFGVAPLFTTTTFEEGSNPIMTMFLRNALLLPFLWVAAKLLHLKMRLTFREFRQLALLSLIGGSGTGCLLFSAYPSAGIGLATCLHFTYPVLIMICCILFFGDRINIYKLGALILSLVGIFFTVEIGSFEVFGFVTALLSGVTYAFYILYMDKTGLKNRNVIVITFYGALLNSIFVGLYAWMIGDFTLDITPKGWGAAFMVSFLATVIGIALLQMALQYVDSPTAAIMCTLEPLVSVFLGMAVLDEPSSVMKLFGCGLIVLSVLLISLDNRRRVIY